MPSAPALPRLAGGLAAAAVMVANGPATAKPSLTASRTAVSQAISDCRRVADRDARLDCYDKAADAFEQAQAQGQVVVVDRAQVREVKRQAFGLSLPSLNLFARGPKDDPVDKITVKLSNAHADQTGKWVMVTEEGAIWRQIDSQDLADGPRPGSTVAIRRASLGSFFCNIDGQSAIRCARSQ